uniref:Nucleolar protein, putative n=1 Tax=Theileria annulata TaxID=5874 RepID=A0A3B0NCM7_THEAN
MDSLIDIQNHYENKVLPYNPDLLSHKLDSWLEDLGVDVEKYKNEITDILSSRKYRYYRKVGDCNFPDDRVVLWLRDVEVYNTTGNIPPNCYGIDASSAAVVDSLRLKRLSSAKEAWVLDMCCAPGGKLLATIDASDKIRSVTKWNIIGLDSSIRRIELCKSMLKKELFDRDRIDVNFKFINSQEFSEFNGESMFEKFDRIILDVECTLEGSLRSVIRTLRFWGIKWLENNWNREYASKIIANQRELLTQAIKLVKPGGFIVYSTCSLDKEQNEHLLCDVIRQFKNIKFHPLPIHSCSCCSYNSEERQESWPAESCEHILKLKCSDEYFYSVNMNHCNNKNSPSAVRFVPLNGKTDGLFIALLFKII